MLKPRELEKIVRGFSNHRRIQILELLRRKPNLSVLGIAEEFGINYKTASEHIRRLHIAGLLTKQNTGKDVRSALTKRGNIVLTFLRTLE